ncbi:MAG: hypothetical protein IAI49_06880, partial [Candidatus Eremiobacteraeota bacterium]|nr:hypothetical protein [Candidatus Eremiobacteraeota bacterium]
MADAVSHTSLPPQVAADLQILREYPQSSGLASPSSRVLGYVVSAASPEQRADRFAAVAGAAGPDIAGRGAVGAVLAQAQVASLDMGETTAHRMRDAFVRCVADGRFTADDARGLVRHEATYGAADQAKEPPGTPHPELVQRTGRISSYIDALGTDSRSAGVRLAFARESVAQAETHRADRPATSAFLYGQAANAFADMPQAARAAEFAAMRRSFGPDAVARFAAGATAGEADRVWRLDNPSVFPEHPFRADGLATIVNATNDRIEEARARGTHDADAQRLSAQLFTGVAGYLSDATGSDLDRALGAHDERTGLRGALNRTIETNFPTVLKQNMLPNGESLDPSAHRIFSGYARFQFDAPDDAHGRQTVAEAQRAFGNRLGTLQGALFASSRDGGRQLHANFGTTFGAGPDAAAHASRTLGELIGSAQNGIDQGFDARADRSAERQHQTQELFERVGGLAKVSAFVASHSGQEEIAGGLEGIEKTADALKAAVPQATPSRSAQGALLGDLRDDFVRQLGTRSAELANPLKDGANDAATNMSAYEEARRQGKTIAEAQRSQDGILGSILTRTLVPSPDSVAQPGES